MGYTTVSVKRTKQQRELRIRAKCDTITVLHDEWMNWRWQSLAHGERMGGPPWVGSVFSHTFRSSMPVARLPASA